MHFNLDKKTKIKLIVKINNHIKYIYLPKINKSKNLFLLTFMF